MTIIDKIAWIRLEDGAILSSRPRGKDVYYLPGGKREPGESDVDTLVREIHEELSVAVVPTPRSTSGPSTPKHTNTPKGRRITCCTADYHGVLRPNSEIEEFVWLTYADRHRVSPVDFDYLHETARLH